MVNLIAKIILKVFTQILMLPFLLQGTMPSKKKEKKGFNFSEISDKLANIEHKEKIDQIEFKLSDTYFKHAKDKEASKKLGTPIYRDTYTQKEAEALLDDIVDDFIHHIHRSYMKIDQKKWKELKDYRDEKSGKAYVDSLGLVHGDLDRDELKSKYASRKEGNRITRNDLQEILTLAIRKHAAIVNQGYIEKEGIKDPEAIDQLKGAIEVIKQKYKVKSKEYDTSQMHEPNEVLEKYIKLSKKFYADK